MSQLLTKLVINANISKKKKITYLYCIAVHYQNCYSKKVTSETLNSLIRLICKQGRLLNACPYNRGSCGKIIQAYYYDSSLKNASLKKQFTEVLQDWAYICNFKY